MIRGAILSGCKLYRYRLRRRWLLGKGHVLWVMLNPSTADALEDDATIRRLIGFSQAWGFAGLEVVNLFALRATDPRRLSAATDPVGPNNDGWIRASLDTPGRPRLVIAAWGACAARVKAHPRRADDVIGLLVSEGAAVHHLGLTKGDHPRHPLYLRRDARPQAWKIGP